MTPVELDNVRVKLHGADDASSSEACAGRTPKTRLRSGSRASEMSRTTKQRISTREGDDHRRHRRTIRTTTLQNRAAVLVVGQ